MKGHFTPHTEETKFKISLARKGKDIGNTHGFKKGNIPWLTGTKGLGKGGRPRGIVAWNKGKKFSELSRNKMSLARIGKSPVNKGKRMSLETCLKMRDRALKRFSNKENHPMWKGGITGWRDQAMRTPEYSSWRLQVFNRDKFLCQMPNCSKIERYLHAHHIKTFAKYPDLRLVVNNGITLCSKCHRSISRKETNYQDLFNTILELKNDWHRISGTY